MSPRTAATVAALGALSAAGYGAVYSLETAMAPPAAADLHIVSGLYIAATLLLFVTYWLVVRLASRGLLDSGWPRALVLLLPLALMGAFTLTKPILSIDVLTYIAQGRQAAGGINPYAQPLRDLANTPLANELGRWGWVAVHDVSPYGPVWTLFERAVVTATASVPAQVLAFKTTAMLFALGCAWLIWLILSDGPPRTRVVGVVLFLWNPAVIGEIAADGHNDSAMIFFALLSLYFFLSRRPGWGALSLGIGGLVKITAGLVGPLEIVYAWRTQVRRRLVLGIAGAGVIVLVVAAASYAPFWIGKATFAGLREHSRPDIQPATTGALLWLLTHRYPAETAARLLSMVMAPLFLGCLAAAAMRAKDRETLLRACGWVALAYLVLAPRYWPWYACLPVALLALSPSRGAVFAIVAVSLGARLAAPIDLLRRDGLMTWPEEVLLATTIGVWLPAVAIAVRFAWLRWAVRGKAVATATTAGK